jgi:hypothetical protein
MATTAIHPEGHTLIIVDDLLYDESNPNDCIYYITLLKNNPGAPKGFREYRISFSDGVVKYMTVEEFFGNPFMRFVDDVKSLTKRVDDSKISLIRNNGFPKLVVR